MAYYVAAHENKRKFQMFSPYKGMAAENTEENTSSPLLKAVSKFLLIG